MIVREIVLYVPCFAGSREAGHKDTETTGPASLVQEMDIE